MITREETLQRAYWNRSDIGRALGVGKPIANKLFDLASQKDDDELQEFRIEKSRVRSKTVLGIVRINLSELKQRS